MVGAVTTTSPLFSASGGRFGKVVESFARLEKDCNGRLARSDVQTVGTEEETADLSTSLCSGRDDKFVLGKLRFFQSMHDLK